MTTAWWGLGVAKYFTEMERQRIADMVQRNRRRVARRARRIGREELALKERIEETEADLARALLLAMSVHRVLLNKAVLAPNDVVRVAQEVDLSDGTADGKLDPRAVWPNQHTSPEPPPDPKQFLRRLEDES